MRLPKAAKTPSISKAGRTIQLLSIFDSFLLFLGGSRSVFSDFFAIYLSHARKIIYCKYISLINESYEFFETGFEMIFLGRGWGKFRIFDEGFKGLNLQEDLGYSVGSSTIFVI